MVFWRNRSEKKVEAPVAVEAETPPPITAVAAATETATNVVTLVTSRLADRLADVAGSAGRDDGKEPKVAKEATAKAVVAKEPSQIKPAEQPHFFGQKRAVAKIRAALGAGRGEHLLIMGEPGTGRLELAEALGTEIERAPSVDWIYVVDPFAPSRAKGFELPPGEGPRFRRDVRIAIDKARAAFGRYLKSEEHRISLDLLEEDMRYRSERAVEPIRRRAEAQNIAVVKSLDGYVLAPMHEGRVVRSDVFRALPEALKRNVEAKITVLEDELQTIVARLPDADFEASEKHDALVRQAAVRAVRPGLAAVRHAYADGLSIGLALDAIEDVFVAEAVRHAGADAFSPVIFLDSEDIYLTDPTVPSRVVVARETSAKDLLGEISRDAHGLPVLLPGHLMRAGSGIVIVEAWRLAADPGAWLALSAAMRNKQIVPVTSHGVGIKVDPVPFAATVVLVSDAQSWSKLEAIEPGIRRHFPHIAKLVDTVPLAELSEEEFSRGAARLAQDHGLRPINTAVAPVIYKDAVRRGGGRVSLAGIQLLHLLQEADAVAADRSASQIRVEDLNEALSRRADGDTP
ncbi:AAA family ATPase [Hyphomicrobium sp.]|uniref:AAA family ATPase n=1 Tax=Hyphomicrobium sp. TaxID=82 RepID=UPI000FA1C6F7|nr:AAA family ATPase [Hyphomicrobium sp.]RUO98387.1 MAG: ATP-dependent protease [Hyphomicrobium sp.]